MKLYMKKDYTNAYRDIYKTVQDKYTFDTSIKRNTLEDHADAFDLQKKKGELVFWLACEKLSGKPLNEKQITNIKAFCKSPKLQKHWLMSKKGEMYKTTHFMGRNTDMVIHK